MGIKNILRPRIFKAEVKAINEQVIEGQLWAKQDGLGFSNDLLSCTLQSFLPWENVFNLEWDSATAILQINFLVSPALEKELVFNAKQLRIALNDSLAKRADLQAFLRSAHEYLQHSIVVSISQEISNGQVVVGSIRRSCSGLLLRFYSDDPISNNSQTQQELVDLAAQIQDCVGL